MTDRDEFIRLLTAHQRAIHAFVYSMIPHPEDAEEVWQETNVVLVKKAEQFQPGTNFLAWALTAARFEVHNFRRKKARARVLGSAMLDQWAEELIVRSQAGPSRLDALQHCLKKLQPRDRELIELRYAAGGQAKAVAEYLGRSLDRIYHSITRIRRALLKCIRLRLALEEHP